MKTYEKVLIGFIAVLFIFISGIQIGIHKGRTIERKEVYRENQVLISELQKEINNLNSVLEKYNHADEVYQILKCESSLRHENIWGDGGKSYGIAQIQRPTFHYLKQISGMNGLNWKDREDQIRILSWSIKNGYGNLWTCYRKLKKNEKI